MGVDGDLQLSDPGRPGGGSGHVGAGLPAGAWGLPKDRVAAAGLGEYELGAVLPPPVQDQVDGGTPPDTRSKACPFHDVGVVRPLLHRNRITVHSAGPRPGPRGAEHHTASQRQQQQIRQPGIRIRIAGDQQLHAVQPPTRAAWHPTGPATHPEFAGLPHHHDCHPSPGIKASMPARSGHNAE